MKRITLINEIENKSGFSLITVIIFILIIGTIVTLVIATSINDTKRLVVEKSYERAYTLSDNYLTNIVTFPGEALGVEAEVLSTILERGNSALSCDYTKGGPGNTPLATNEVELTCQNSGPNKDSQVVCNQLPINYGVGLIGIKDKSVKFNLSGIDIESYSDPTLLMTFNNTDALQISFRYTKGDSIYQNYSFGIRQEFASDYTGMIEIGVNRAINEDDINDSETKILKGMTGSNPVITKIEASDLNGLGEDFVDAVNDAESFPFSIHLGRLLTNIANVDGVTPDNYIFKSVIITFLSKEFRNAKYSIAQVRFPDSPANVKSQFRKISCKTIDAAVSGSNLISGFGSAELETYVPINKTIPGILDYSIFVGRENTLNSPDLIETEHGASVKK